MEKTNKYSTSENSSLLSEGEKDYESMIQIFMLEKYLAMRELTYLDEESERLFQPLHRLSMSKNSKIKKQTELPQIIKNNTNSESIFSFLRRRSSVAYPEIEKFQKMVCCKKNQN